MRPARGFRGVWAGLRRPWVFPFTLCYLCGLSLLVAFRRETLREVLLSLLIAGLGLIVTAWATRGEGSRPGPAPHPWIGVLLVAGLTVFFLLRLDFIPWPVREGPLRELLSNLFWGVLLPASIFLLSRVPWSHLGLPGQARTAPRWRRLGVVLAGVVTLPALALPGVLPLHQGRPLWGLLLVFPLAYAYAWLARALPQEFLFRQVFQPRLQVLVQPTAGIFVQAIFFGVAGAGRRIAAGEPWPWALLVAVLQGSILGLFYGLLRDRTRSLVVPISVHAWLEMWTCLPVISQWLFP